MAETTMHVPASRRCRRGRQLRQEGRSFLHTELAHMTPLERHARGRGSIAGFSTQARRARLDRNDLAQALRWTERSALER